MILQQNRLDHFPRHIRQPEIAPLELIRQPLVIDPQAMQNRRLQIVHMHRIFGDVVAVIVGLAVA